MDESLLLSESYIKEVLTMVEGKMESDITDIARHYLEHSEYEMAFEGLFIEIIDKRLEGIDPNKAITVARQLQLDNSSVFDDNFWIKFLQYFFTALPEEGTV